jgi:hypothetical protein
LQRITSISGFAGGQIIVTLLTAIIEDIANKMALKVLFLYKFPLYD